MYIYTIRPLCLEFRILVGLGLGRGGVCGTDTPPLLSADPAGVYYTCALYKRRVRALLGEMVMTEIYETRVHYIIYTIYYGAIYKRPPQPRAAVPPSA